MNRIVPILIFLCIAAPSVAQEKEQGHSVLGLHVGPAFVGSVYLGKDDWSPDVDKSPVIQLAYDYVLRKGFSLGATIAYQFIDVSLVDTLSELTIEEGQIDRMYLGGRALWHYGKNPKWDIYSGVKFGIIVFSPSAIKKNHNESSIIAENHTRSSPRIGLIPIGCRYHLSDNFLVGVQISVGAPTLSTLNINYAF